MKTHCNLVIILLSSMIVSCKPTIKQLFLEGDNYFNQQQYSKAVSFYTKVLIQDSTNQLAYFNRGKCYSYLDSNQKALNDFNKIISLVYQKVHNSRDSILIVVDHNSPLASEEKRYNVPIEEARFERAKTEFYVDSLNKSFNDFTKCAAANYKLSECHRWLGLIYYQHNIKDESCKLLKQAMFEGDEKATELVQKYCQ